MGLLFECLCADLTALVITAAIGLLTYVKWSYTYWERHGVPSLKPTFPFGTAENPFTRKDYIGIRFKKQYDELKSQGHKHGGLYLFTRPTYLLVDPEYVKNVMSKDFSHFVDRGMYYNEKDDPLSAHLFNIEGQKWKKLRAKLTPTFTSGKIKMMFQTLVSCSDQLVLAMDDFCEKKQPVDIKDVLGCFTTDVIGSCAFGIDCNSFKDPEGDFRKYGKKIFASVTKLQAIKNIFVMSKPDLARALGLTITSPEVSQFFLNVVKDTVEVREKTNFVRKDFMQILIDLKNSRSTESDQDDNGGKHDAESLTIEEVAAQAFVFFLAGFETSSTTMAFCLFELALNPDIQNRVREEINHILQNCGGRITYEAVMELKYLAQVVDETLRKYPPASVIPRKCVEDYPIPGTHAVLKKGMRVMIPALALHRDPQFFPHPEEFDPDRFNEENRGRIQPYTYIPFGDGPRVCIGARFGLLQTKVGLAALLKNYRFSVNQKTKTPLEMDPFSFILNVKDGIWLDIEKLSE